MWNTTVSRLNVVVCMLRGQNPFPFLFQIEKCLESN